MHLKLAHSPENGRLGHVEVLGDLSEAPGGVCLDLGPEMSQKFLCDHKDAPATPSLPLHSLAVLRGSVDPLGGGQSLPK